MTEQEQTRIAQDIDAGWQAARAGQPRDAGKSEAWLYGYSKGDSPFNPARWETPLGASPVIPEHDRDIAAGMEAALADEPRDPNKSPAWRRGHQIGTSRRNYDRRNAK